MTAYVCSGKLEPGIVRA